ncbi:MAG: acyl-phosphate glycerol 3-phosphate acyltransferase [Acidobacteria bacterium]|nr:MAG: acyl-phosphate glycerol 3-phosphate acyltransferase [Acidobacteriota bacterium]
MWLALIVVLAYLLGSIPFGYLIVRLRGGGDVRASGSGGTGATNVTRRAGKGAGLATLALDALKGVLAVVLARQLLLPNFGINWWVAAAAFAAIVGHCFPVWLKFRGGKGVATGLGVFLALAPAAVGIVAVVFLLVVWRTRYVSLGSITAAACVPLCIWVLGRSAATPARFAPLLAVALAGSALIIYMHRANIGRLLRGTENKLK